MLLHIFLRKSGSEVNTRWLGPGPDWAVDSKDFMLYCKIQLDVIFMSCFPSQDPRFAGSNPAEVDVFPQDVKILSTSPPGGTLSWGSRV